jgi:hypothetical protein
MDEPYFCWPDNSLRDYSIPYLLSIVGGGL